MTQAAIVATSPTPSVLRRLASFVYEGMLLFAVLMIAGYLFSSLTQQRHALTGRAALQGFLFLVLGVYFVWFWSHGGQTLAMKTWRIRLIGQDGLAVSQTRALVRYMLSWLWFAPALFDRMVQRYTQPAGHLRQLVGWRFGLCRIGLLHGNRQFVHDVICRTRLISTAAPSPA